MKISVYIATSVDGYIAARDGGTSWLQAADKSNGSEDYGYGSFLNSVDCLVIGRHSMESILNFPRWAYDGKRVVVMSRTLTAVPEALEGKIELYSGSLNDLVEKLGNEQCGHLYVDGGKTIQSFLQSGLITDITITKVPVLLGGGVPLFGDTEESVELKHLTTTAYPSGFVQSSYQVI